MEDIQQIIVNEHMEELRHDAEARRLRDPSGDGENEVVGAGGVGPARVLFGAWLIGVGTAVAGSAGDRRGGTVDSAL